MRVCVLYVCVRGAFVLDLMSSIHQVNQAVLRFNIIKNICKTEELNQSVYISLHLKIATNIACMEKKYEINVVKFGGGAYHVLWYYVSDENPGLADLYATNRQKVNDLRRVSAVTT